MTVDGWSNVPLKALFRRRDETGRPDLPLLSVYREHGVVPRSGREDNFNRPGEDLTTYRVVRPNDLVLNKMKTWQGSLGIAAHHGIVSPAYIVCEPIGDRVAPRYVHHLLRSPLLVSEYASRSKGIRPAQWDLPWNEFRDIDLHIPTIAVQRQIADFLDAESPQIDALIEKKRLLGNLVERRWQASVRERLAHLATRAPLKRRWHVTDCKHQTPTYVNEGYPVVSPGDMGAGRIDLSRCHRFVDDRDFADLTEGRRPQRGDVIYSRNASAGTATYVDTDEPFCMGQDVCLITSRDQDQRFLMYALNTVGADQLAPIKIGSTITRINVDQIGELQIPAPCLEVQHKVADSLDHERDLTDRLLSKIAAQITLLAARRQALITEAVTGQLDVARATT